MNPNNNNNDKKEFINQLKLRGTKGLADSLQLMHDIFKDSNYRA